MDTDSRIMSIWLMMGSSDEIIKYLKSEGVKTKKIASAVMRCSVMENANKSSGIANSSYTMNRVLEAFDD